MEIRYSNMYIIPYDYFQHLRFNFLPHLLATLYIVKLVQYIHVHKGKLGILNEVIGQMVTPSNQMVWKDEL